MKTSRFPGGLGTLQLLFCSSPKGCALPLLLPHCGQLEARLLPVPPASRELWAASPRAQRSALRGGESPIISYEFSSLFLGNQPQRLILARTYMQQRLVKRRALADAAPSGRVGGVILAAANAISCCQTSVRVIHNGKRVLWSNPTLCPPVGRTASCQGWSGAHSGLVGVFGPGERQQGWINSHGFNDARRGFSKGVCISPLMVCTASATKLWGHRLVKEKNTE